MITNAQWFGYFLEDAQVSYKFHKYSLTRPLSITYRQTATEGTKHTVAKVPCSVAYFTHDMNHELWNDVTKIFTIYSGV